MRLTAEGARAWRARSRAGVALLVLTAWFGTLLVAMPTTTASATSSTVDPTFASPPAAGTINTPSFAFTANGINDPVECGWATAPSTGPTAWTACTSPYQPTLTDAEGTYNVWIRSVNTPVDPGLPDTPTVPFDSTPVPGDGVSTAYVIDRTNPVVSLDTSPLGAPSSTDGWVFKADEPATITCVLSGTSSAGPAPCGNGSVFPGSSLADGSYTITATGTDRAGNTGTASTTYSQDTSGPVLALAAGPTGTGNDTTPNWKVTANGGEQVDCSVTRNGSAVPALDGRCDSGGYPGAGLGADGTYILTATATDLAGNPTSTVMATYVLDTVKPIITLGATGATDPTHPSWAATVDEAGVAAQCRLTGTTGSGPYDSGISACGTTYVAGPLAQGTYSLAVTATDAAGNSAVPVTRAYTFDITAPALPSVGGDSGYSRLPTISWTAAATDTDTDHLVCVVTAPDSTATTTNPCGPTPSVSLLPTDQGVWTLSVTAVDASGNASAAVTRSVTYDHTLSAIVVAPRTAPAKQPVWHVTVDPDATATCSMTGVATATDCTNKDFGVDLAGKPGAVYTLSVSAVDLAGNTTSTSVDYILAPDAPTVSVSAAGRSLNPTWTISAQSGATLTCHLVDPNGVKTLVASCAAGTIAPTLTATDGTWNLEVVATISTPPGTTDSPVGSSAAGYALDTTPPGDPTISTTPSGPQNTATANWTITAASGTTRVDCGVFHDGTLALTVPSCQTGGVSLSFAAGDEGAWQVKATAYDQVGNTSNLVLGPVVTYDITAPNAPDILPLASPSNDPSPTWTINTDVGTSLACSWTTGNATPTSWFACSPFGVINVPADGIYTLHARATDAAGNTGPEDTQVYELDRSAPAAPTFSTPSSPSSSSSVSWTITAGAEVSPTLECRLVVDGGSGTFGLVPGFDWSTCTSPHAVTLPAEGRYRLQSRVTDQAGNLGPVGSSTTYVYDQTPPQQPTVTGPTGPSQTRSVTWTITPAAADGGTSLQCRYVDNGVVVGSFATCGTTVTRSSLADGTYAVQVRAVDDANNVSTPLVVSPTYVVDNVGPVAPTFGGSAGTGNVTSTFWTFSGEAGATPKCVLYLDGVAQSATPATCASGDAFALTAGDGAYQVEVLYVDAAGNDGVAARSPIYLLDTQAPARPVMHGPTGTANTTSASYTFTAEAGTTAACRLLFVAAGSAGSPAPVGAGTWGVCTSPWSQSLTQGDGSYEAEVHVTDAAGNVSPDAQSEVYTLDTTGPLAPTFTA
ncbi:MAG: Cable pili-associated 22 kDa adhesin protein, partial [Frankiales bacterium]|nr:Cable pili-associated 22 kDa adhesin protein [Frankiales bacterium]